MHHKTQAIAAVALAGAVALGFGLANYIANPPHAIEARLIGDCGGRVIAAAEESDFPAGCNWTEPIRYLEDGGQRWREDNGGRALRLANPITGKES